MKNWARFIYDFYAGLKPPQQLPNKIEWLYPQQHPETLLVLNRFLEKFYNDSKPRQLILGINPGRFGAGVTGVNFTAAKQLTEECGIDHPFKNSSELSAEFIYTVINAYGGAKSFYQDFFIGSVCPLGFVQNGKNINYYDDKHLLEKVEPFIVESISKLSSFNTDSSKCICIGGEKNLKHLSKLNDQHRWFQKIIPVPHPRFIMQYKRKSIEDYINLYLEVLKK